MPQDKGSNSLPDRWYVQIDEQTLGPMVADKIMHMLVDGDIQVVHRVSRDKKAWSAICNTQFFEDLIRSNIDAYSAETATVGKAAGSATRTISDKQEIEALSEIGSMKGATAGINEQLNQAKKLEELTANIQKFNYLLKEIQLKRKSVKHQTVKKEAQLHEDDQDVFIPTSRKGFDFKSIKFGSVSINPKLKLIGVVALIISVVVFLYAEHGRKVELANQEKLKAALAAKTVGDYALAIARFQELEGQPVVTGDQLIEMADAYIQRKEPKKGQALITQAMGKNLSAESQARAHSLNSQIAMQSGDIKTAESELEHSLKQKEMYSTLHNLGVLKLKKNNASEAEALFLKALQIASDDVDREPAVLGLFETALSLDLQETAPFQMRRVKQIKDVLLRTLKAPTRRHDELNAAMAITMYYLGEIEIFKFYGFEIMERIPMTEHSSDQNNLDYDLASFKKLSQRCRDVYNLNRTDDFIAAFFAACVLRSHGPVQALPYAEYAHKVRPADPGYGGLYGYLLFLNKKNEAAKALLSQNHASWQVSKLATQTLSLINAEPKPSP